MTNQIKIPDTMVQQTIEALRNNGFEVWLVPTQQAAEQLFWNQIFQELKPHKVSWGDSLTLHSLDILSKLRQSPEVELIQTFGAHLSHREQINNRKKALSADLFLSGSNAITMNGQIVNLDMIGNRIAGIAFGPRKVVIFSGVNKIVKNMDAAFARIRSIAAPLNAKRHADIKTPCQRTGICSDCNSPHRICNSWLITEKSYPVHRTKIILINNALGL
ncbi:MAG: lactate utilization protein [Bacillota bacterium]|nr:lactate utilization protein [Bacillota bacterium]